MTASLADLVAALSAADPRSAARRALEAERHAPLSFAELARLDVITTYRTTHRKGVRR